MQADANYYLIDEGGRRPMHWAAESGCSDGVKAVFERGASVDWIDHAGGTRMHLAASMVHVQLVQTRSELEADVTTRDKKGESPILNAAENGPIQVRNPYLIGFLKSRGVNPSPRDYNSQIPIHQAASLGRPAAIKTLFEFGVEISIVDVLHWMPMHCSGHTSVIEASVDLHAKLSPRNRKNSTPIHEALKAGHQDAADVLRKLGANRYAIDSRGRRLCDYEIKKYETKKRKTDERAKTGESNQRTKNQK